ncbi:MAG: OmpA family protein [Maritimibacter sp.]
MKRFFYLLFCCVAVPEAGFALDPVSLPAGAQLRFEDASDVDGYAMPIGPFDGERIQTRATSGAVTKRAWRIGGTGQSTFQIYIALKTQLEAQGYNILFECDEESCGGYDFRFGTTVIDEPEMHVDLGDFQFLSAQLPGESGDATSILVSRSANAGFVQMIHVGPTGSLPATTIASTKAGPPAQAPNVELSEIGSAMEGLGRYIMADLVFQTGTTALGDGSYQSLSDLAGYLVANPKKRVALIGHTDAEGSLAANITVSERRAASVKERLVRDFGVPQAQLEAKGIGYLAPIASNQTEEGRNANRRVEAILISTE